MRDFRFHDLAALHGGKVVLRVPPLGVELADIGQRLRLERLLQHRVVAVELDPDFVEIVGAAPEGQVAAPVVAVAAQGDMAADLVVGHGVGAGADGHVLDPGGREILVLPLGLLQDRAQPGDQRQLAVGRVEGDPHAARPGRADARDLGPERPVAGMPLFAQHPVRPDHVLHRDRAAVGERRLLAQREFDPFAVRPGLDRFGQQPVKREGLVPRSPHQRFVGEVSQLPRRLALEREGVERVESPHIARHHAAALGGVGVGIGQGHKIRWQGGVSVHSYAVGGRRRGGLAQHCKAERGQNGPPGSEKIWSHSGNNPARPLFHGL